MPEVKGFSERNIDRMIAFYREYPDLGNAIPPTALAKLSDMPISPPVAAKLEAGPILQPLVAKLPWAHNVILMEMVKDISIRSWCVQASLGSGWSSDVLSLMISSRAHERQGRWRCPPRSFEIANSALKCARVALLACVESAVPGFYWLVLNSADSLLPLLMRGLFQRGGMS